MADIIALLFKMKYLILLVCCLGVDSVIKPSLDASIEYQEKDVINKRNFYRPCSFNDWECIRKFLAKHSNCKPAYGRAPDPLYWERNTVYFPLANMTNILAENTITGLACSKIIEFYYNKKTHNLVFAMEVNNMNETIQKSIYRYRRTAKESIVLTDFATVLFKKLIFTAVIPKIKKLRMDLAEFHADIQEDYPAYYVGPKAYTSKDPDVQEAFNQFVEFWPILLREAISSQVRLLTCLFIQNCLCDYGLKLKSY